MSADVTTPPVTPYADVVWICCCFLPPCIAVCTYSSHDVFWPDAATRFWAGIARSCLVGIVLAYAVVLPITSLFWLLLRRVIGSFSLALIACLISISPFIGFGQHVPFSWLRTLILCAAALGVWGFCRPAASSSPAMRCGRDR